jgi:hypothetical protein
MEHIDSLVYSQVNNIHQWFSFPSKIANLCHFLMTLHNKISPLLDKVKFQQRNILSILILVFSKILPTPLPPLNPVCSGNTGRNISG